MNAAQQLLEDPRLATLFVAMTHDLQFRDADKPRYTSLDDFDRVIVIDGGRVAADGAPGEAIAHYRGLIG